MSAVFRIRIVLDLIAVTLIIACLAYWWLDNLTHELFGSALFTLVIVHNVFNRRWYGAVAKQRMDTVRTMNIFVIVGVASGMIIMLVTSLLLSRDLYPFTALEGSFTIREIHMFAGYWLLLLVAIHLGTRWKVVMNVGRSLLDISGSNSYRTVTMRLVVFAIVAWGIKSSIEMAFVSKLMFTYSLDMWDFNESTAGFFLNYGAIVGMFAAVSHYGLMLVGKSSRKSL